MKIWFFSAYDRPRGQSSRTYDYACKLTERGHTVSFFTNSVCHYTKRDIITGKQKWMSELIDGIDVIWLKTPNYKNNLQRFWNMVCNAFMALRAGKEKEDIPDIIVGPTVPLFTAWAAQRLAFLYNCPFILEIRDIWPQVFVDQKKMSRFSLLYLIFRFFEKYLYKKASVIVTTLPLADKHVADSGSDPCKVIWIPNGVNLNRFEDVYWPKRKKNQTHFVYTGTFGSGNDLLPVIDACAIVDQINQNWLMTLVGGGNQQSEIEKKITEYDLAKKIILTGYLEKQEIPAIIYSGDVMIISLLKADYFKFGCNINKLYDYFAAGRPIIFAGDVPNDPVKASGAGYSVSAGDVDGFAKAMLAFMALSQEKRIKLGKRARYYAEEHFDINKLALAMEQKMLFSIDMHRRKMKDEGEYCG